MWKSLLRFVSWALTCLLLTACIPEGNVNSKLDMIEDNASCAAPAKALVVLLPGIFDKPEDLVREGFVAELRKRNIAADVILPETHIGYYTSANIVKRLHEDIVLPAKRKGYSQIWMTGISLGGYGSLFYSKFHGELVTGVFVMAPFLGADTTPKEVAKAGGLDKWQAGPIGKQDYDRQLWAWLQAYARPDMRHDNAYPKLYIGYGSSDRFAATNSLLAKALPAEQVMTTRGGHDWSPWRRLWKSFLDRRLLPSCSQPDPTPSQVHYQR